MTRILFLPAWLDGLPRNAASPRIRCQWVAKYWPEADVYDGTQSLAEYDVHVYQKAYLTREPREWARRYDAVKICDICDPEWLTPAKLSRLYEHLDLMAACVVPTSALAQWFGKWLPVHVIPDCVDLEMHTARTGDEEPYFPDSTGLVWVGGWQNYTALETLIPVITTLDLPLATISDRPCQGLPFIRWENVEQANEWIKRFDILLNPQPDWGQFRYKSDNKTVAAWALGVPVAHDARELHELLRMTSGERLALGQERRRWVEEHRSAEVAARMWREVVQDYTAKETG